jgi:hypothetical protein
MPAPSAMPSTSALPARARRGPAAPPAAAPFAAAPPARSNRRARAPPPSATAFRPCIDIHKGVVKQIVGGSLRDLPGGDGCVFLLLKGGSPIARG